MLIPLPPLLVSRASPDFRRIASVAAVFLLFGMLVIGTRPLQIRIADPATAFGDTTRQAWYIGIVVLLLIGSQTYRQPARLLVLPISMMVLLAWCTLTLFWSSDPDIGGRRLLLTALLIWTVFRITDELGYEWLIPTLRWATVGALALNYLAVAISPVAIHQAAERVDPNLVGCWRGFLEHKNYTGALCAVTILLFVFGGRHWRLPVRLTVLAAAGFFLYKTGSKTSMNMLLVSIVSGWLYLRYNPNFRALLVPLMMVAGSAVAFYLSQHWGALIAPLSGADQSVLTGRVVIWPVLLHYWRDHFWGAGFGAFWNVGLDGPVFSYAKNWVTGLGSGHNGYLDLLITIGPVGLGLAVLATIILPIARILASKTIPRPAAAWAIAVITFALGHNLTESTLLERDAIVEIFLMFAVAQIAVLTPSPMFLGPRTGARPIGRRSLRQLLGTSRDMTS